MRIEIKCRFTAEILFETEAENLRSAVEIAIARKLSLRNADLEDADLRSADLVGADLRNADLRGANLRNADIMGANLRGANLMGADLGSANLEDADLVGANLVGANLRGADLGGANLVGADLVGANLVGADLSEIKADYLKVLAIAKNEVSGLYKALLEGRVDGSTYTGECACLVGTIANVRHESPEKLGIDLRPDSTRLAEKWFLNIRKGDTPANNQVAAIVKEWTEKFCETENIKLPVMTIQWSEK